MSAERNRTERDGNDRGGGGGGGDGLTADVAATFTDDGTVFDLDASLSVAPGETLVVLGPSGSGKTLLLETVAGFHPHEGRVELDGRDLTDAPPERRGFGFVFQDYALFPHMTARENAAFGARYHEDTRDPDEVLAELGVADLADRSPRTLSGGERQRVALARSLAIRPDALLLDEPLSALDVPTRQALRDDLADVLADVTAVYVTHNRTTARALADRIAAMRDGGLVQVGTPGDVFERPTSPFVAEFTGANCLSRGALDDAEASGNAAVDFDLPADATHVAARPEYVRLDGTDGASGTGVTDLHATVTRALREDATTRVVLALDGADATLTAFVDDPPAVGETVGVGLPRERLVPLRE